MNFSPVISSSSCQNNAMDSSEQNTNQISAKNDPNIKSYSAAVSASICASRNLWEPLSTESEHENELYLTYNPPANSKTSKTANPNSNDASAISGQTKQPGRGSPAASSVNNNKESANPSRRQPDTLLQEKMPSSLKIPKKVNQEKYLRAVADVIGGHNITIAPN